MLKLTGWCRIRIRLSNNDMFNYVAWAIRASMSRLRPTNEYKPIFSPWWLTFLKVIKYINKNPIKKPTQPKFLRGAWDIKLMNGVEMLGFDYKSISLGLENG